MRRERITGPMSRWQPWRWVLADVVPDEPGFGSAPRCLLRSDDEQRWLHPGFVVELFKDDAEGYDLNVRAPAPCWFVMWRMEEADAPPQFGPEPIALPQLVSLSYHDAGRLLDAQETVEQVAAPAAVVEWLRAFVADNLVAQPRRRQRPESFKRLEDRFGNPALVSTGKLERGGNGG